MAVKVIYIAGVPASGKSTLMRRLRGHYLSDGRAFREGKAQGIVNGAGTIRMLGVFDGSTFEGTDKLSMTVIDDALAMVRRLRDEAGRSVLLIEGDRLFNRRFIGESRALLLIIDANEAVLAARHKKRGDNQSPVFLKGRRSKVENYIEKYGAMRIWNNTNDDAKRILNYLTGVIDKYLAIEIQETDK